LIDTELDMDWIYPWIRLKWVNKNEPTFNSALENYLMHIATSQVRHMVLTSQSRAGTEYAIPTDNIILLN